MFNNGEKRYEIVHLNDLRLAHPESMAAPASRPKLGRPKTTTTVSPDVTHSTEVPKPPMWSSDGKSKQTSSTGRAPRQTVGTDEPINHETSPKDRGPSLTANEEFQGTITGPPPQPAFRRPTRSTRNPNPYYIDGFNYLWPEAMTGW